MYSRFHVECWLWLMRQKHPKAQASKFWPSSVGSSGYKAMTGNIPRRCWSGLSAYRLKRSLISRCQRTTWTRLLAIDIEAWLGFTVCIFLCSHPFIIDLFLPLRARDIQAVQGPDHMGHPPLLLASSKHVCLPTFRSTSCCHIFSFFRANAMQQMRY